MPLAVKNGLLMDFSFGGSLAVWDRIAISNKNPLRAMCEVLVMIKLEGNGE